MAHRDPDDHETQKRIVMEDAETVCSRVGLDSIGDASVLVTGASGLIGSFLLATLCRIRSHGGRPRVFAQVASDPPPHVSDIVREGNFELVRADLSNPEALKTFPEADLIVHSGGYAQPALFMANPVATIQVNTSATAALIGKLRPGGRFLFVSSSEVYSGLSKPLLTEDDIGTTSPSHPRASYIEGKRCGEAICNAFRSRGIHAVSARVSNAYGPGTRKHDKRSLNTFIEKALCLGRIDLLDAGTAIRTFLYVADTAELLWKILLRGRESVYNVGGKTSISIANLARMIASMTDAEVVFPSRQAEVAGAPADVRLDVARVEAELGAPRHTGLPEGLAATIAWQRALYLPIQRATR